MRNPFRTESDAFHLVWLTIGVLALIVAGAAVDKWVGVGVACVAVLGLSGWILRGGAREQTRATALPVHPPGEHRILVVANETVAGGELLSTLQALSRPATQVLVVSPALNSPLRHWASDEDGARTAAGDRLEASLAAMRAEGIDAHGQIGDGDPVQAIEDALRLFAPDEIVISTHPPGRSNWLERNVVERSRTRFSLPVTHVVVDLGDVERRAQPLAARAP